MIQEPIFIIGAPRSGTSILFRTLSLHSDLWHLPRESHAVFEGPFHPRHGFESNRVTADDVTPQNTQQIRDGFEAGVLNLGVLDIDEKKWLTDRSLFERVRNRLAIQWFAKQSRRQLPGSFRLLEKTPKNSLRVSALNEMFPDARFIYLEREASQNIDSLLAGWRSFDKIGPIKRHRFCSAGYEIAERLELQDYDGPRWKFALIPDWQRLKGQTCADVAAAQYFQCTQTAREDLLRVSPSRVFYLQFDAFVADPVSAVSELLKFADLNPEPMVREFAANLPRVNDATPHLKRKANQLRYPDEVDTAVARWKDRAAA